MANTTFKGPVRTGRDPGYPTGKTIGTLVAQQAASVAANTSGASTIVLPPDTRVDEWTIKVHAAVTATLTQGALVRIGSATDATKYANFKVSAAGFYRSGVAPNATAVSAAACLTGTGADAELIYIDVTAAVAASAGDMETLQGMVVVDYFQRS